MSVKFHVYSTSNFTERYELDWCICFQSSGMSLNCSWINSVSPEECDYFVIPMKIKHEPGSVPVLDSLFSQALYYKICPERHIFFLTADCCDPIPTLDHSVVFQMSSSVKHKTYCMPYKPLIDVPTKIIPIDEALYDVSFQGGTDRFPSRLAMLEAVKDSGLNSLIKHKRYWCSATNKPINKEIHQDIHEYSITYIDSMNQSRFVLSPRGLGLTSIRFYEAMALGRIPVLLADETKLPLEWKINYNELIVRVPEDRPDLVEGSVRSFARHHDLTVVSRKCRAVWDKYFSETSFEYFLSENLSNNKLIY